MATLGRVVRVLGQQQVRRCSRLASKSSRANPTMGQQQVRRCSRFASKSSRPNAEVIYLSIPVTKAQKLQYEEAMREKTEVPQLVDRISVPFVDDAHKMSCSVHFYGEPKNKYHIHDPEPYLMEIISSKGEPIYLNKVLVKLHSRTLIEEVAVNDYLESLKSPPPKVCACEMLVLWHAR